MQQCQECVYQAWRERTVISMPFSQTSSLRGGSPGIIPDPLEQPQATVCPPAFCGGVRNAQCLGSLFDGQASEVPQLHQCSLVGVFCVQSIESRRQCEHIDLLVRRDNGDRVPQVLTFAIASMNSGIFPSRLINENSAHGLGCSRKEVAAILPLIVTGLPIAGPFRPINELQVDLVNKGGGLDGLAGLLACQSSSRQSTKFVVDLFEQPC